MVCAGVYVCTYVMYVYTRLMSLTLYLRILSKLIHDDDTDPHHHHVCPCCVVNVVLLIIVLSSSQDNKTALILASENGHSDVVNTLIAHGADVNVKDVVWTIQ